MSAVSSLLWYYVHLVLTLTGYGPWIRPRCPIHGKLPTGLEDFMSCTPVFRPLAQFFWSRVRTLRVHKHGPDLRIGIHLAQGADHVRPDGEL